MTNDEMASRLIRLEIRQTALTAMVHCLLPATLPERRHLVAEQFGHWRSLMEKELHEASLHPGDVDWHVQLLAAYHDGLVASLVKVTEFEQTRMPKNDPSTLVRS